MHFYHPIGVEITVEPEEGVWRARAIDICSAFFLNPQADIVANRYNFDLSQSSVDLVLIDNKTYKLDHLPFRLRSNQVRVLFSDGKLKAGRSKIRISLPSRFNDARSILDG